MIKSKLLIVSTLMLAALAACGNGSTSSKEGVASGRDIFDGRYTDDQLFDRIYSGTGNMPPFKNSLTEEQINLLLRFIREEI